MTDPVLPVGQQTELEIKAEMLKCRHFNGVQHDECKAGVNYRTLAGEPAFGCMTRIPCLPQSDPKGGPLAMCQKRETPDRAKAFNIVTERDLAFRRHLEVFKAAKADAKAKGLKKAHGGESQMACPACGGVLRYSVSSYNGHMHARCETKGCVSWME